MSRNFVRRIQSFTAIALFVALVTILLPIATLAQQRGTRTAKVHRAARGAAQPQGGSLFLPAVSYDIGSGNDLLSSVAVGDLNGDGYPDVVVVDWFKNLAVLLGKGDGTLQPPVTYSSSGIAVFIADVNGDHKPDLIEGTGNGTGVRVLLGNGDGTFQPAATYASGGYPWNNAFVPQILVGDLNGDGKSDLVVSNECDGSGSTCANGTVGILLGNGDGTFRPVLVYNSGGAVAGGIVLADFNHDGKTDLAVSNCADTLSDCGTGNGSVGVLLGNGDGTFQPAITYGSGSPGLFASALAEADLNRDGKPDLVIANPGGNDGNSEGSAGVLLGNGDGTFQPVVTYDSGGNDANSIEIADLNNDGIPDLVLADISGTVGVLLGKGDGTFGPVESLYAGGGNSTVGTMVSDINGDGIPDIVAVTWGPVDVLLGLGDGTFQGSLSFTSGAGAYSGINPASAIADLNGDSKPDVLTVSGSELGVLIGNSGYGIATTIRVNSSLNPSNYGQSVTFTAVVTSGSGTPAGTVIFYDGTTPLGSETLAGGSASLSTSSLSSGSHAITASYLGSGDFAPSTSPILEQAVTGTPTSTALSSSRNPSFSHQNVVFTATVSCGSGTPGGSVIFYDSAAALDTAVLSDGVATFTDAALSVGSHSITASYQGFGTCAPSTSAALIQVVNQVPEFTTKTSLATSGSPSLIGQPVTFTATITSKGGTIPDGEVVSFYDGAKAIGTGETSGGRALLATSSLTATKHTIKATYSGDANFRSSSGDVAQVVEKYATTTALSANVNPAEYGQAVTFTATVTSAGPATTGKVKFTGIGVATLSGGVAVFTKKGLRPGTHAVTAEYLGDGDSATSESAVLDEVVNPAATTTKLTSSVNPSSSGQNVTFTATVTSATGLNPTGSVTFAAGGTALGAVSLKGTVAKVSTATLPAGDSTDNGDLRRSDWIRGEWRVVEADGEPVKDWIETLIGIERIIRSRV
jgi:hypothetical protein